ncbi:hypothetical protein SAMN04487891_101341 [Flagellimonas taeanensis]|uniref:Uncharacterized protein n=1 Tax=Flagellimonas taeanensis TaxID=1005926 RepID=A0A1M6PVV1_9FLAO|nr:hypothetical protein [Allomuricauda taeanensis]SFB68126.1 hypothetical protein SAMN04487891_101341 [Allomuricauda taeanensis]SHK12124.1 hypothetical protein SAMN05216293_0345 [Allomuricauda taeanensis]
MGFASHAVKVVKANRALLHKRRSFKEIREAYEGYVSNTELKFKNLTPFEQKKIRDKIIQQAKRDRLEEIQNYCIALVILIVLGVGLYSLFSS